MAIAVIGGLVVSTALSLVVVPTFFVTADGMAVRVASPLAVDELRGKPIPMTLVSEREIAHAVRDYALAGIRVEGSGAASLAAHRKRPSDSDPVVLIVTGRNIDDDLHRRCVEEPDSFPD